MPHRMSHVTFGSFFNFLYIYEITVHYMTYDLIVIGAGPAGLTAGIYARTKMMSTLVLDAGVVGGQLVSLYPEKGIHNYPGYETIQARKLSDKLYAQAESLGCEIREKEKVMDVDDGNEELIVRTDKAEYHTKSIIVAIGMGMFKPRRMGCDGELELEGKGLSYILPLKEEIVGKKVVVFGGGNSAIEMAMMASTVTDTTLVHRRPEFRADESNVKDLASSKVKPIMNANLKSVNGRIRDPYPRRQGVRYPCGSRRDQHRDIVRP